MFETTKGGVKGLGIAMFSTIDWNGAVSSLTGMWVSGGVRWSDGSAWTVRSLDDKQCTSSTLSSYMEEVLCASGAIDTLAVESPCVPRPGRTSLTTCF